MNPLPSVAELNSKPRQSQEPTRAEGDSRRRAGKRLLVLLVLVVLALGGAFALGTLPRLRQQKQLDAASTDAAAQPPRVTVAVAHPVSTVAERVLPGNSLPLLEAALYARATGYIKTRSVDIGDRVTQGQ